MYPSPQTQSPHHDPNMLKENGWYPAKKESNSVVVFLNVVNTLTNLFLGAVAFSAFSYSQNYTPQWHHTQHIFLCVSGYVILMGQAILSMNPRVGWAQNLKYPQKRIIHAVMQIMGSILAIAGSILMFIQIRLDAYYITAHGVTGYIALLLTVLSLIGGCVNFAFAEKSNANLFKTAHSCLGSLTITMAFVTLCLGFDDWTYRFQMGDINANLSITYTVFALMGILIFSSSRIFKRLTG